MSVSLWGRLPYASVQMSDAGQKSPPSRVRPRWVKREHVGGVRACLRVWPQVDVVFGHEALPVVELGCVPVRVILHVGDLDTGRGNTHPRYK